MVPSTCQPPWSLFECHFTPSGESMGRKDAPVKAGLSTAATEDDVEGIVLVLHSHGCSIH